MSAYGTEQKSCILGRYIVDTMPCKNLSEDDPGQVWETLADGNETLAVYNLQQTESIMAKLGELGSALLDVYNRRNEDEGTFTRLMQASDKLSCICDGKTGQVDVYLLARTLADAGIIAMCSSLLSF